MIVVAGLTADPVIELMRSRLMTESIGHRFLDLAGIQDDVGLNYRLGHDGRLEGEIELSDGRVRLADVRAAFVRFVEYRSAHIAPAFPTLGGTHRDAVKGERQAAAIRLFDNLPGLVINRPRSSNSNHSKPYQQVVIHHFGLRTPPTLVTTSPDAARTFIGLHKRVIAKSLSGIRSKVRLVSRDDPRLDLVRNCPTQLQREIEGTDVRVHIVGDRAFAVGIESDATDYRYALEAGSWFRAQPITLPPGLPATLAALTRRLNLALAGIDLRLTPDGSWYCFEVNPAPAFLMYERLSGEPISLAVAEELARADSQSATTERSRHA